MDLELEKLSHAASQVFAQNTTLGIINEALLEKDVEMKKRAQHSRKQLGKGLIMGQEILDEQKSFAQLRKNEIEY